MEFFENQIEEHINGKRDYIYICKNAQLAIRDDSTKEKKLYKYAYYYNKKDYGVINDGWLEEEDFKTQEGLKLILSRACVVLLYSVILEDDFSSVQLFNRADYTKEKWYRYVIQPFENNLRYMFKYNKPIFTIDTDYITQTFNDEKHKWLNIYLENIAKKRIMNRNEIIKRELLNKVKQIN